MMRNKQLSSRLQTGFVKSGCTLMISTRPSGQLAASFSLIDCWVPSNFFLSFFSLSPSLFLSLSLSTSPSLSLSFSLPPPSFFHTHTHTHTHSLSLSTYDLTCSLNCTICVMLLSCCLCDWMVQSVACGFIQQMIFYSSEHFTNSDNLFLCLYICLGKRSDDDASTILPVVLLRKPKPGDSRTSGSNQPGFCGRHVMLHVPRSSLESKKLLQLAKVQHVGGQPSTTNTSTSQQRRVACRALCGDVSLMTKMLEAYNINDVTRLDKESGIYLCYPVVQSPSANEPLPVFLALLVRPEDEPHSPLLMKILQELSANEVFAFLNETQARHAYESDTAPTTSRGVLCIGADGEEEELPPDRVCCPLSALLEVQEYYPDKDVMRSSLSWRSKMTINCILHDGDVDHDKQQQASVEPKTSASNAASTKTQPHRPRSKSTTNNIPGLTISPLEEKAEGFPPKLDDHREKHSKVASKIDIRCKKLSQVTRSPRSFMSATACAIPPCVSPDFPLQVVCHAPMEFLVLDVVNGDPRLVAMPHARQVPFDQPTPELFMALNLSTLDYVLEQWGPRPVQIISVISPSPPSVAESSVHSSFQVSQPLALELVNRLAGCTFHEDAMHSDGVWIQARLIDSRLFLFLLFVVSTSFGKLTRTNDTSTEDTARDIIDGDRQATVTESGRSTRSSSPTNQTFVDSKMQTQHDDSGTPGDAAASTTHSGLPEQLGSPIQEEVHGKPAFSTPAIPVKADRKRVTPHTSSQRRPSGSGSSMPNTAQGKAKQVRTPQTSNQPNGHGYTPAGASQNRSRPVHVSRAKTSLTFKDPETRTSSEPENQNQEAPQACETPTPPLYQMSEGADLAVELRHNENEEFKTTAASNQIHQLHSELTGYDHVEEDSVLDSPGDGNGTLMTDGHGHGQDHSLYNRYGYRRDNARVSLADRMPSVARPSSSADGGAPGDAMPPTTVDDTASPLSLGLVACFALSDLTILAVDDGSLDLIGAAKHALDVYDQKRATVKGKRVDDEKELFDGDLVIAGKTPTPPDDKALPNMKTSIQERDKAKYREQRHEKETARQERVEASEYNVFMKDTVAEVKRCHSTFRKALRGKTYVVSRPSVDSLCALLNDDIIRRTRSSHQHSTAKEVNWCMRMVLTKTLKVQQDPFTDHTFSLTTIAREHYQKIEQDVECALSWGHVGRRPDKMELLTKSDGDSAKEEIPDEPVKIVCNNEHRIDCELRDTCLILYCKKSPAIIHTIKQLHAIFFQLSGFSPMPGSVGEEQAAEAAFEKFVQSVCNRRVQRTEAYVTHKLETDKHIPENRKDDLMQPVRQLPDNWRLCFEKCSQCHHRCLLPLCHNSLEDECMHDCLRESHACTHTCQLCPIECRRQEKDEIPEGCTLGSGHEDAAERFAPSHLGPARPATQRTIESSVDCDSKADHPKHVCNKPHACPDPCGHPEGVFHHNCETQCKYLIGHEDRSSERTHECEVPKSEHQCKHTCDMPGCQRRCTVSATGKHLDKPPDGLLQHFTGGEWFHLCDQTHECQEWCDQDGVCMRTDTVLSEDKIATDLLAEGKAKTCGPNALKLKCGRIIPKGERTHGGRHNHEDQERSVHFCDEKCPLCGFVCGLDYEHDSSQLHETQHGPIEANDKVIIDVTSTADRQDSAPGTRTCADVCNHGDGNGRGHTHVVKRSSRYWSIRRTSPKFHMKDLLTHRDFWRLEIGFRDPYSQEQQENFAKCPNKCTHNSHSPDEPVFCEEQLWHEGVSKTEHGFLRNENGEPCGYRSTTFDLFSCSHPCLKDCHLKEAGVCEKQCAKSFDHERDCRCSSKRHDCPKTCEAKGCKNRCASAEENEHSRHACSSDQCLEGCSFEGCDRPCSVKGHFGHDGKDHLCDQSHPCPKLCDGPGSCSLDDGLETVTMGNQVYKRKRCVRTIDVGMSQHEGPCSHSYEEVKHICSYRCPLCHQPCVLDFPHSGKHEARHGKVIAMEGLVEIRSRSGQRVDVQQEKDEITCFNLCPNCEEDDMLGHLHLRVEDFISQSANDKHGRDALVEEGTLAAVKLSDLHPTVSSDEPDKLYVSHAMFWKLINFKDPVTSAKLIKMYNKCPRRCPRCLEETEEEEKPCSLEILHKPLDDTIQNGPGEHVSRDGHHYPCWHPCFGVCEFSGKCDDCNHDCSRPKGHSGNCRCSLEFHPCTDACTALSCDRPCELTLEAHAASSFVPPRHDCGTKGCPAPCKLSKLCSRRCGSDDHFHELSTVGVHLCGQQHRCPELCDGPGVCPMDTSSGDSDWADLHRRQCAVMIPCDQWEHKGRHKHSTVTPLKHLCGHQCKLCKRPCVVSHGHMDAEVAHNCKHGPIVQEVLDALVVKNRHGEIVSIPPGTRCVDLCRLGGRGHVHATKCEKLCETLPATVKHRGDTDDLRHDIFWDNFLGFEDQATPKEREDFLKCTSVCREQHSGNEMVMCDRQLWHPDNRQRCTPKGCWSKQGSHQFLRCTHRCREPCEFSSKSKGCTVHCNSLLNHQGDHRCNGEHICPKPCDAPGCTKDCAQKATGHHQRHLCKDRGCKQKCSFGGCHNTCADDNHFHGVGKKADCKHLCNQPHVCREMCNSQSGHALCTLGPAPPEAQGDSRASKWSGLERGKHQCRKNVPAGHQQHSRRSEHICSLAPGEHFCGVPCPFCNQPCHLKVNHDGLHDTLHTASKYKYDRGQKGLVPIRDGKGLPCFKLCSEAGRGHVHQEECSVASEQVCHQLKKSRYSHDLASSGLYQHTPRCDIFTHAGFWFIRGFKDPHSQEERHEFTLCPNMCAKDGNFCKAGKLWHQDVPAQVEDGSDGYVFKGHAFPCFHQCDHECVFSKKDGDNCQPDRRLCALPLGHPDSLIHECQCHRQICREPCCGGGSVQLCKDPCKVLRTEKHSVHTCGDESKECPFPCLLAHECGRRCGSKDHLHDYNVRTSPETMAHVCGVEHHPDSPEVKAISFALRSAALCHAVCPMCKARCAKKGLHDGLHTAVHVLSKPDEHLKNSDGDDVKARKTETCFDICRRTGEDHWHVIHCDAKSEGKCPRAQDSSLKAIHKFGMRTNKDSLPHSSFWKYYNFEDPLGDSV